MNLTEYLKKARSNKDAGFMYRFWLVDEVCDGVYYRTRAQFLYNTGRWCIGFGVPVLGIIGFGVLLGVLIF